MSNSMGLRIGIFFFYYYYYQCGFSGKGKSATSIVLLGE
jgi:hypothetical protein